MTATPLFPLSRKAEEYLIASGLTYTIVHPGGLLDAEGRKRRLVIGVDDTLLERKARSIPRADVAQVRLCAFLCVVISYFVEKKINGLSGLFSFVDK